VNRRGFLRNLGLTAAGVLVAEDLLSTKTFFLPPAKGWYQGIRMREVQQYDINNDWMPIRHDAAWLLPNGEIKQYHVTSADVPEAELPHSREVARLLLEDRARHDGLIDLPQVVLRLPKTAMRSCYT
jgi:hypothetical protein